MADPDSVPAANLPEAEEEAARRVQHQWRITHRLSFGMQHKAGLVKRASELIFNKGDLATCCVIEHPESSDGAPSIWEIGAVAVFVCARPRSKVDSGTSNDAVAEARGGVLTEFACVRRSVRRVEGPTL